MKLNKISSATLSGILFACLCASSPGVAQAEETNSLPKACIDGQGPGWVLLGEKDFTNVNVKPETWSWTNGIAHSTGLPIGVIRTVNTYTNFELVAQWRHLQHGGNSGIFALATPESIKSIEEGKSGPFPSGIEVQVLDHGYKEDYEKNTKKKATWFTTNGDVFAVGATKMKPFPPLSPDGSRSFPRKELSKGVGQWNHYYVRCINGEIRLWVNGEEVSGGNGITPAAGYLCLESEGAPVEFKEFRVRELP
ncbi:MAG: hypothetical protein JWM68_2270 [Verrucomicrobiales bacterium]|nr:hypothetical protein [Verrucomicrobiales bacterium]